MNGFDFPGWPGTADSFPCARGAFSRAILAWTACGGRVGTDGARLHITSGSEQGMGTRTMKQTQKSSGIGTRRRQGSAHTEDAPLRRYTEGERSFASEADPDRFGDMP